MMPMGACYTNFYVGKMVMRIGYAAIKMANLPGFALRNIRRYDSDFLLNSNHHKEITKSLPFAPGLLQGAPSLDTAKDSRP